MTEPMKYDGGAKRSEKLPMYRLIPESFLRHVAATFAEGNVKYENGNLVSCNWRKGGLAFQLDCLDHLTAHVAHANQMITNVGIEGGVPYLGFEEGLIIELAHAAVNIAFLIEFIERHRMIESILSEAAKDAAVQGQSSGS